jgi:hypothetical protein
MQQKILITVNGLLLEFSQCSYLEPTDLLHPFGLETNSQLNKTQA